MGEQTAKAPGLNRAKTYQLVLFPLNNGATNVYYVLVLSYIATFGSKVLALSMIFASVMVTGMRLFDAITDPIIGALMDRTNGKFGKFRQSERRYRLQRKLPHFCIGLSFRKHPVGSGSGNHHGRHLGILYSKIKNILFF